MQKSACNEFLGGRDPAHRFEALRRGPTAVVTVNKYVNCTVGTLL